MNIQHAVFERLYRRTPDVDALPWHREEPPALLRRVVEEQAGPSRALDVGCGEGVYATYLAQQGASVVGLDFVAVALDATRRRAERAGVEVELHRCEVTDYEAPSPFDLVLDSGCLHHLPRSKVGAYRSRLDEWLAPGGDFVLVHFSNRPKVGWIPKGPRHMSRAEVTKLFAPLELRAHDQTTFDVPFPMGRMQAGVYWFTRPAD